jgi:endonuclease-3
MTKEAKPICVSKLKRHAAKVIRRLHSEYPDAHTALDFETPLELLIATILSAQCTDVRVNIVTKKLFKKYRNAKDYVNASPEELDEDIQSINFHRNKTRSIRGACKMIIEEFGGKVPQTMEDLVKLPGVARKTANVVLGTAFGIPVGMVVDTHVKRVTFRLGITRETSPEKVERDLMKIIPKEEWIFGAHALIWHGRQVCHARKPDCDHCVLQDICPKCGVKEKR